MSYTYTKSTTFTITDIAKVVSYFGADYDMIAQSTGLYNEKRVSNTIHDVTSFAQHHYVTDVYVILHNSEGYKIQAAKYEVNSEAYLWNGSSPGDNLWTETPDGDLNIILRLSKNWYALTNDQKSNFLGTLKLNWISSDIDLSFSSLSENQDRCYVSNGYGLRRTIYS